MAITYVTSNNNDSSSGTLPVVMPNTVAVGDLLIGFIGWPGAGSNHAAPAIADTVNTGAWNLPSQLHFYVSALDIEIAVGWIRCDTAGTPTVTASNLGTDYATFDCVQFTGFVHAPSLVTADVTTNSGTGTAITATGLTNSVANELMILVASIASGGGLSSITGSFPDANFVQNNALDAFGYVLEATSGNALTSSGTSTPSGNWGTMVFGFQDAGSGGANTAPLAWIT